MTTPPKTDEHSEVSILRTRLSQLEQCEQLLRSVVATSSDFIAIIDRSGRYREILPTPIATPEVRQGVGKLIPDILPRETADLILTVIAQVLSTAVPFTFTYSLPAPAGERWFTATVSPHVADAVLWVAHEITEQYQRQKGHAEQAQEARLHLFETLTESSLDGIAVASPNGAILYANPAFKTMTGYGDSIYLTLFHTLYTRESQQRIEHEATPTLLNSGRWRGELQATRPDGTIWTAQISATLLTNVGAEPRFAAVFRDMTEHRNAEQQRLALQEQVIATQQAILREMATPLIPLTDHVVVLPLVGSVDSARAQQIMETLLEGVVTHRAQIVIVDISGVRIVDTQVADALIRSASAVKLLGAELILTGIRPEIAQTIVRLGADLQHLRTLASLQAALRYVLSEKSVAKRSPL